MHSPGSSDTVTEIGGASSQLSATVVVGADSTIRLGGPLAFESLPPGAALVRAGTTSLQTGLSGWLVIVDPDQYAAMIARIHEANRNIVIVRADDDGGFGHRRRIDVWLYAVKKNGALVITLATSWRPVSNGPERA